MAESLKTEQQEKDSYSLEVIATRLTDLGFEAVRRAAIESDVLEPVVYGEVLDQQAAVRALLLSIVGEGGILTHDVISRVKTITGIKELHFNTVTGLLAQEKAVAYIDGGYAKPKNREEIVAELNLVA